MATSNPSRLESFYQGEQFRAEYDEIEQAIVVRFHEGFCLDQWEGFEQYYRAQMALGYIDWHLHLEALRRIDSRFIGMLIGFNTLLLCRKGSTRIYAAADSNVLHTLTLCRLNQIIKIIEVELDGK